jgi:hypothetical protein
MSILKKALIRASGNRFIQRALEKNVQASQDLMGIGSGGFARSLIQKKYIAFEVLTFPLIESINCGLQDLCHILFAVRIKI